MLPKRNRLSRALVGYTLARGKRAHSEHVSCVHTKAPSFRAAVVVSKKVARTAVVRNTLRRRMFSVLRELRDAGTPLHIIVILKKGSAQLDAHALSDEVRQMVAQRVAQSR